MTAAIVGGVALPLDSLALVERAANAALAPLGISIQLPHVVRSTVPTDRVQVTSLRIMLKDSPAGKIALGPILNLTRAQREQLFDAARRAIYGPAGAALLAADVATSIVSGSGFLSIEVGGVEASSGPIAYHDPFGPGPSAGSSFPATTTFPALPTLATPSATGSVPLVPGAAPSAGAEVVGALTQGCRSLHRDHPLGCSSGLLVPVGIAGIAGAVGVAALDVRHQRRRRASRAASDSPARTGAVGGRHLARSYLPVGAAALAVILVGTAVGVPRTHIAYQGPIRVPATHTPAPRRLGSAPGWTDRPGGGPPTSSEPGRRPRRVGRGRRTMSRPRSTGARRPVLPALLRVPGLQRRRHHEGGHRRHDQRQRARCRGRLGHRHLRQPGRREPRPARTPPPRTPCKRWPTTSPAGSSSTGGVSRSSTTRAPATASTSCSEVATSRRCPTR